MVTVWTDQQQFPIPFYITDENTERCLTWYQSLQRHLKTYQWGSWAKTPGGLHGWTRAKLNQKKKWKQEQRAWDGYSDTVWAARDHTRKAKALLELNLPSWAIRKGSIGTSVIEGRLGKLGALSRGTLSGSAWQGVMALNQKRVV